MWDIEITRSVASRRFSLTPRIHTSLQHPITKNFFALPSICKRNPRKIVIVYLNEIVYTVKCDQFTKYIKII